MPISRIDSGPIKIYQSPFQKVDADKTKTSFAGLLQGYMENVNTTVKQASDLTTKAAAGEIDNIHDVTIASQKAKLALELTVAIRDKAVECYQEMMRMQI
ncbi:flagellar hook-basal body complex protein FliE [Bacillus sp. AFS073361]|uniref:flagellar hook-basal body complex protein FliE n=1 Tax=Bacillus sp. AFS073361 TaxID=2033511 RepID=UPI000BF58BEB|nr:flagellar hook-basal body complex protein FliE [Bacillus sp. AFS073361]PFP30776.1 flagellar hook-basal body complex protein FliE [Bacillus sp. AFS073361]